MDHSVHLLQSLSSLQSNWHYPNLWFMIPSLLLYLEESMQMVRRKQKGERDLYLWRWLVAHAYHINSISVNSDGETYISADDLRINLWNLDISDQSFSKFIYTSWPSCITHEINVDIVDIKPANMEELTEVITAAEFHPLQCNLFMYSSSKGTIKMADMRESALCDQRAKGKYTHTW